MCRPAVTLEIEFAGEIQKDDADKQLEVSFSFKIKLALECLIEHSSKFNFSFRKGGIGTTSRTMPTLWFGQF
jgi:hypothetical protein